MIVIGAGRLGTALSIRAREADVPCQLVTREVGWDLLDGEPGTPVLVAARAGDLPGLLGLLPVHRRDDLVLVQDGMLRPWLVEHGLARVTRGVLTVAVDERGDRGVVGRRSACWGVHAAAAARWLGALGVPAEELVWSRFVAREVERLIWISTFGLLCERFDLTVAEVCRAHSEVLPPLVGELSRVCRRSMGIDFPLVDLLERLVGFALTVGSSRPDLADREWTNDWFSHTARARRVGIPLHDDLLAAVDQA